MKKYLTLLLSLVLVVSLAGCGGEEQTAKEIVMESIEKTQEINSLTFDGKMNIELDMSNVNATNEELAMLQMFPGIEFTYNGTQTAEPLRAEMDIQAKMDMQGMNFTIDLPIMMTENQLFVKIPGIYKSQLQMVFPEMDETKEYISVDLTESMDSYNSEEARKETLEMVKSLMTSLDDQYFVKEEAKNYSLETGKVGNVVSVQVNQENLKPLLKTFMQDSLPLLLNQLDKYVTDPAQKEQFEQMKQELETNKEEINKAIDEIDKYITVNELKATSVYDKDGFERKTIAVIDLTVKTEDGSSIGVKIDMEQHMDNINQEVNFEMPLPTEDQIIDLKELEQMGAGYNY